MIEIPRPSGTFKVKVKPNALRNEICFEEGVYKVNIKAPADKNKANKELIRYLSKWLGRKVAIKSGFTSREKLISFYQQTIR
ncbi:MAG: hypothetical protein A2Y06_03395 [Omnitrophica WOR_2 bacterium GWA2_37_7]|nr:MAG: hypothetical protein A2Y06_03395 [Omnitrophica WOR_2 bacterium GWA2_37_7]